MASPGALRLFFSTGKTLKHGDLFSSPIETPSVTKHLLSTILTLNEQSEFVYAPGSSSACLCWCVWLSSGMIVKVFIRREIWECKHLTVGWNVLVLCFSLSFTHINTDTYCLSTAGRHQFSLAARSMTVNGGSGGDRQWSAAFIALPCISLSPITTSFPMSRFTIGKLT